MGVYRVETSPNNRAGCINKECKAAGVKILKGEFRYAIQVTIKEHTSWQYKHWGCVTPKQIDNLIETSGGDTEMVDGYDELPDEYQEKVRFALEHGHVPDEDWKGDIEANRDGRSGMRLTKAELKKKEKDAGEDPDTETSKKKRGKKVKDEEDKEDKAPAPKKKSAKSVKNDDDAEDAPAPKKRGRVKTEADNGDEAPAPKKARAARGKKVEYKEEEDEDDEAPSKKKMRGKTKAQKSAAESEAEAEAEPEAEHEEDDEIEKEEEQEVSKPKRGRKTAANSGAKASQKRGKNKTAVDDE